MPLSLLVKRHDEPRRRDWPRFITVDFHNRIRPRTVFHCILASHMQMRWQTLQMHRCINVFHNSNNRIPNKTIPQTQIKSYLHLPSARLSENTLPSSKNVNFIHDHMQRKTCPAERSEKIFKIQQQAQISRLASLKAHCANG